MFTYQLLTKQKKKRTNEFEMNIGWENVSYLVKLLDQYLELIVSFVLRTDRDARRELFIGDRSR